MEFGQLFLFHTNVAFIVIGILLLFYFDIITLLLLLLFIVFALHKDQYFKITVSSWLSG